MTATRPAPRIGAALLLAAALALPAPARADTRADAAALFREAQAAFAHKNYRAAALGFEEANRRAPAAAAVYNAAVAWRADGAAPRAADDFALALDDAALVDPERADARRNLAELERILGVADVTAPAGSTLSVAHLTDAALPRRVHLPAGEHTLRITLPGGDVVTRVIDVHPSSIARILIEPGRATAPDAAVPPARAPRDAATAPPAGPSTTTMLAVGSFVLAGVAAGTTAIFGVRTVDARDAYEKTGFTDADARAHAIDDRTLTNVSLVAACVFAAAGVVLLLTAHHDDPKTIALP